MSTIERPLHLIQKFDDKALYSSRHRRCRQYHPPLLTRHGSLGPLIRGASWKGIDSVGELDPDQTYPG